MSIWDELFKRQPATALEAITWQETSGVDHPANLEEGWVVLKSADGSESRLSEEDLAAVAQAEEEWVRKAVAGRDVLVSLDLSDAPADVRKAQETLLGYFEDNVGKCADEDMDEMKPRKRPSMMAKFLSLFASKPAQAPEPESVPEDALLKALSENVDALAERFAAALSGDISGRGAASNAAQNS